MAEVRKRKRERKIQKLLRAHPYLLDRELLNCRGRIERRVGNGRLDIDFQTDNGWIVVECKCGALTNRDLKQLCRYLDTLAVLGKPIWKSYLVGGTPKKPLQKELLQHPAGIMVKEIPTDIPTFLAFSEGRHYFDAALEICPYDSCPRIPGKELALDL